MGGASDEIDDIHLLIRQFVHRREDGSEIPLHHLDVSQPPQGTGDLEIPDILVQEVDEIKLRDLDFSKLFDGTGEF
jgi:hypothetical protein